MKARHLLATFVALSLVLISSPVTTRAFSDVSVFTPYATSINALFKRGAIEGYSDGTFKPKNTVNRAEFVKIVLEGREEGGAIAGEDCFPDVTDEWFAKYVCTAKKEGIIGGYPDGTFKPERDINFVEASKIISLAFGNKPEFQTNQWYEGYVRALESSKAIPVSIANLEHSVSRGEMVEMMWRLSENRTDQQSKGFLNVKYPGLSINLAEEDAQVAGSCADIRAFAEESRTSGYGGGSIFMEDAIAVPMMARSQAGVAAESSFAPVPKADFSETNVQVEGVDEGDIVKTDGTYLYIVRNQNVSIVRAYPPGSMELVANLDFSKENFTPSDLYLDGNRFVVIGNHWEQVVYPTASKRPAPAGLIAPDYYPYPRSTNRTQVRIYELTAQETTNLVRTVSFEGNKISTRKIGNKLYLVMNQHFSWGPVPLAEATDDVLVPQFKDSAAGNIDRPVSDCNDIVILPRVPQPQYLIVAVVETDSANAPVQSKTVLGNAQNIYASLENLYVAATRWQYHWQARNTKSSESTDIYRFALTDDGIEFKAKGKVPGRILNQFSMDEHNNTFRIATTIGQLWDENNPSTNNLYILSKNLEQMGAIEDIAPGERIYSARFMGDRAYMVTFKKVDPFFVIDTSDPNNPQILGKLKIPGYSDYLHPYDRDHVIGFGKEAVEAKQGDFAWYQGMKIAVFDVSDVANPVEKHKLTIGDRGTNSPLLHNHKALLFEKDRNLMAFPVRLSIIPEEQRSEYTGSTHGQQVFQGAQVYKLDMANGFQLLGQISHYTDEDMLKSGSYFYGKDVERIVRVEDALLTISQVGVQSHDVDTIEKQGGILYVEEEKKDECPDADDEDVFYVSNDPDICATIDFFCKDDQEAFSNECGCGCVTK